MPPKRASTSVGSRARRLAFGLSDRSGRPGLGSKTGLGVREKEGPPTAAEGLRDGDADEITSPDPKKREFIPYIFVCMCVGRTCDL